MRVARRIHHKVERQAKCLVQMESLFASEVALQLLIQPRETDLQNPIKLLLLRPDDLGYAGGRVDRAPE